MVFVDASYILALLNRNDEAHARAKFHLESMRGSSELLLVIEPVIADLVTKHNVEFAQQTRLGKFLEDLFAGKVDNFICKRSKGEKEFVAVFKFALGDKVNDVSFSGAAILQALEKHPNSWVLTYDKSLAEAAKKLGQKVLS